MIALQTERLQLAGLPKSPSFTAALFGLFSDPHVMRYMNFPAHRDAWDTEGYLGECQKMERYGRGHACAVYRRDSGAFIGVCTLQLVAPHAVEIGVHLLSAVHRQGYGTELARALAEWSITLNLCHRVSAQVDARNEAARRGLERAGFAYEGTLKRVWPGFGEPPRDACSYAVTR